MKKGIEEKRPAEDRQCRRPLHTLVRGRGNPRGVEGGTEQDDRVNRPDRPDRRLNGADGGKPWS